MNKLLFFLLIIFISRKLGVEGLGSYGYLIALMSLFFHFSKIGETVLIRDAIQKKRDTKKLWGNSIIFNIFIKAIIYLAILAFTIVISLPLELRNAIYLLGILLFLDIFLRNTIAILIAHKRVKIISLTNTIQDILTVTLSIIFIYFNKGLVYIILAFCLGRLIQTIILNLQMIKFFSKPKWEINFSLYFNWLKQGIYFTLQGLLSKNLFKINLIIIIFINGLYSAGLYEASSMIISNVLESMLVLFGLAIYPHYIICNKSSFKKVQMKYLSYKRYILILGVSLVLLLFFLAKQVIFLLYGQEFKNVIPIFKIFLISVVILALNNNNRIFLNSIKKEKISFYFSLVMLIINILLSLVLIKPYGVKGVALAIVLSSLIYLISSEIYIKRLIKKRT